MADLNLAAPPLKLILDLIHGSDFLRVIEPMDDATFPVGAAIILDFGNPSGEPDGEVQWAAVVTPTEARWDVDVAEVNALIAAWGTGKRCCDLRYIDGASSLVWARTSQVKIHA